jgi:penicillin-binding protein 1A
MNLTSKIYYTDSETGERVELTQLYGSQNRVWVNYDEIPKDLIDAFIAIEDERFYSHKGVDWRRTLGAVMNVVMPFSGNFGGSTLTQQLIKNLTDEKDVTIQRKALEILRALNLERRLSKEQILEMYLNTVYLGQNAYGIRAAAEVYFGKPVSELTLAECASLAGITNSPTYYDPFQNRTNNKRRQKLILAKMLELGSITENEYRAALKEPLNFHSGDGEETKDEIRSYFVDLLINQIISDLKKEYNYSEAVCYKLLYSGGLQIEATIDPKVQAAMEQVFSDRSNFPIMKGTTQPEAAMVVLSPEGNLLGVVGGIGEKYGNRVLNRAVSRRQVGSAIKPVTVYAPALEYRRITPYTIFDDSPPMLINSKTGILIDPEQVTGDMTDLAVWPVNSNRRYTGLVTATDAVARSLNTVAVRVLDLITPQTSYDFATKNMGLSLTETEIGYSALALGGTNRGVSLLEMTAAYVPFLNSGIYREPSTYFRVLDSEGAVLLDKTNTDRIAISPQTSYYMRSMLESVMRSGTGTSGRISGFSTAGKTGTTSSDYDRWFIGFTPYYVGGVWFGFDINKEISGISYNPSLATWKKVMDILHEDKAPAAFPEPTELETHAYCLDSGMIPTAACQADSRGRRVAYGKFFPGDAPVTVCNKHVFVDVCTESGDVANSYCPEETVERKAYPAYYRYFALPNVVVEDEHYMVHLPGALSEAILQRYYPAISRTGHAIEGSCTVHTHETPVTTAPPETDESDSQPPETNEPGTGGTTPPEETTTPDFVPGPIQR